MDNLELNGIDCHIGSQITTLGPFQDAIERISNLLTRLSSHNISLAHVDVGGGLGVRYQDEQPPVPQQLVDIICKVLKDYDVEIVIEPGRSIVGSAGVLLTRVLYIKNTPVKKFAIVDAAMNDLIRPVLYDAWQEILVVDQHQNHTAQLYDVVGPVCETADYLGLNRELRIGEGDLLAICDVGAYGFCMSSNYNARPRAAEVMVSGAEIHEIRRREKLDELYQGETILPK
jgi:diaminopimelate decarboxylase